jgi:hypothetical protein
MFAPGIAVALFQDQGARGAHHPIIVRPFRLDALPCVSSERDPPVMSLLEPLGLSGLRDGVHALARLYQRVPLASARATISETSRCASKVIRAACIIRSAGSNVRGALVGRNVLFPGNDDPLATAMAVQGIVHEGFDAGQAVAHLKENRGRDIDRLSRWVPG